MREYLCTGNVSSVETQPGSQKWERTLPPQLHFWLFSKHIYDTLFKNWDEIEIGAINVRPVFKEIYQMLFPVPQTTMTNIVPKTSQAAVELFMKKQKENKEKRTQENEGTQSQSQQSQQLKPNEINSDSNENKTYTPYLWVCQWNPQSTMYRDAYNLTHSTAFVANTYLGKWKKTFGAFFVAFCFVFSL